MEYLDHDSNLSRALNIPGRPEEDRPILDPNIPEARLRSVYSDMVSILPQLARYSFDEIGGISNSNENDEFNDEWIVTHPPSSYNMNELVQLGGVPEHLLPQHPFKTASAYFLALAELHLTHLASQRNDAIDSEEDCRKKYIARCLFRRLARENRLCRYENGPFKLVCDDLRPANVLANSEFGYSTVGVIDWEFSYAAPAEFTYSPPFWLLLERPEYWEQGLGDWTRTYEKRLEVFLQELRKHEDVSIERGLLSEDNRPSDRMRESWENGDFWVSYAANKSRAFDIIYWAKIDRRFFGDGTLGDRLGLLTPEERDEMDGFVQRKLKQKEERVLEDGGTTGEELKQI